MNTTQTAAGGQENKSALQFPCTPPFPVLANPDGRHCDGCGVEFDSEITGPYGCREREWFHTNLLCDPCWRPLSRTQQDEWPLACWHGYRGPAEGIQAAAEAEREKRRQQKIIERQNRLKWAARHGADAANRGEPPSFRGYKDQEFINAIKRGHATRLLQIERELASARERGQRAKNEGLPETACPFREYSESPLARRKRVERLKGWAG